MSSDETSVENAHRMRVQFPKQEYQDLFERFKESALAEDRFGHSTYASNSPIAEYVRQLLMDADSVDVSDYQAKKPRNRNYSRVIHLQLPPSQYQDIRDEFSRTPIADDTAGRGCFAGNSPPAEYIRRCIRTHLSLETDD
ncbi:hypothetical protein [Natrinema hispanicum]|nr:hypothetical protein [Natrinema hispanicum]